MPVFKQQLLKFTLRPIHNRLFFRSLLNGTARILVLLDIEPSQERL
jgi:hypothetical protein